LCGRGEGRHGGPLIIPLINIVRGGGEAANVMAVPSPTVMRGLFIILLSHFHFPLIVICKFKKTR
jgi:hypothetical protein